MISAVLGVWLDHFYTVL